MRLTRKVHLKISKKLLYFYPYRQNRCTHNGLAKMCACMQMCVRASVCDTFLVLVIRFTYYTFIHSLPAYTCYRHSALTTTIIIYTINVRRKKPKTTQTFQCCHFKIVNLRYCSFEQPLLQNSAISGDPCKQEEYHGENKIIKPSQCCR